MRKMRFLKVIDFTAEIRLFCDCASNLWIAATLRRFGFVVELQYLCIGKIFVASYQIKSGAGSPQSKVRLCLTENKTA